MTTTNKAAAAMLAIALLLTMNTACAADAEMSVESLVEEKTEVSAQPTAEQSSIDAGRVVFQTIAGIGCKTCHGDFGEGDLGVGPYIRGATEGSIRASVDATNEMSVVRMTITEDDIVNVAAYLEHLGSMQVARTLSKRGRFLPGSFETRPGTKLQLVIKNSGIAAATYNSDNMGIDPWTIPGRSTEDVEWQAPDEEGEYSIYCSDCKLKDQFFVIKVDANAPPPPGTVPTNAQSAGTQAASDGM